MQLAPILALLLGLDSLICAGRGKIGGAQWPDRTSRAREYSFSPFLFFCTILCVPIFILLILFLIV